MRIATLRRVRFSLRSLLATAALVAIACFWVRWPRVAAEGFVLEHYSKEPETLNPFRDGTAEALEFEANLQVKRSRSSSDHRSKFTLSPHKRTMLDVLVSRQTFDYGFEEFTICRGKVVNGPIGFWDSYRRFYR